MNVLPSALGTIVRTPVTAPRVIAPSILAQAAPAVVSRTPMTIPVSVPSPSPVSIAPVVAPTTQGAPMTVALGRATISLPPPPPPAGGAPSGLRLLATGGFGGASSAPAQTRQAIAPSPLPLPTAVTDAVQQLAQQAGALVPQGAQSAAPFQFPADPQASSTSQALPVEAPAEKTIIPGVPNKTLLIGGAAAIGLLVLVLMLKD